MTPSTGAPSTPVIGLEAYRDAVARSVVELSVHSDRTDDFRGSIEAAGVGDIHVLSITADQHAVQRTAALIAHSPDQYVKFTVVEQGCGLIVQDGREAVLRPGDMAAYLTDRPYSIHFDDAMSMTVVMFPRTLLSIPAEPLARMTAVRYDGATGVGAMVRPFLSSLGRPGDGVDPRSARRLYRTAVDMVGALMEAELAATPSPQDDLLHRIDDYIDEHLSDHELDPTQIARAHYISVRHLHALFSDRGTTVSTAVRSRRLERCYDALVNPANANRSVSAIAMAHGFVDAAHFSRSFRSHFGVSPSALRA